MSKDLEALQYFYNLEDLQGGRDKFWESYRIIEKSLKALEIIRKNRVDIVMLLKCNNVDDYNFWSESWDYENITQEEFELLKAVLS